ncbi:hypothetical protein ASF64_12840 [Arthrobacter sp. Leaf137]|nr:hypothetical protein ASF64_12840 [Arthrobacter sp. Leaf137]
MFQDIGLVVDLIPAVTQHFDKAQFQQPVPATIARARSHPASVSSLSKWGMRDRASGVSFSTPQTWAQR